MRLIGRVGNPPVSALIDLNQYKLSGDIELIEFGGSAAAGEDHRKRLPAVCVKCCLIGAQFKDARAAGQPDAQARM